jgi:hypothetical protein
LRNFWEATTGQDPSEKRSGEDRPGIPGAWHRRGSRWSLTVLRLTPGTRVGNNWGGTGTPGVDQGVTTAPAVSIGSRTVSNPLVGRSSGSGSPVVSASTVGPAPDTTAGTPAVRRASTRSAVAG